MTMTDVANAAYSGSIRSAQNTDEGANSGSSIEYPVGVPIVGSLEPPPWQSYIRYRLSELWWRSGRPGYPSRETINDAWRVAVESLSRATPTPSVVPGEDAAVEFVWNRNDWHLEIAVGTEEHQFWAVNRNCSAGWLIRAACGGPPLIARVFV